ncbi:Protein transport protein sec1 OS=Schizosaccharomyces pombe (strain 972 / ATCC 24843) GN=sec1 PE=3 SV=1 [Rhizoctonia solani AG-1 IB]|uniref:Protein transport protein sec1 n=2 Tax=Rhizoctonia solani TaxID=456999 RepID=A0A0B7FVN4_THACB|nr:Protein transport protein sec1 OS=Schizosaccharomyces pombe (strain 972 / ATCC 24843) GN=sec1 PE=3 SV=1 [Rhizoctonia solani AG-1 IB]
MASLIEQVRKRFLEAIQSVNPPGRWKVLVVDDHSKRLLSAVLKDNDVLQENVTLIESINTHRGEQSLEAMYLLMPTTQNVNRIIDDFSQGRKRYGGAHLFFIDGLPEPLLNHLVNSPAEPHLRTLQDLYVNFAALEHRIFSIRSPSFFFSMYAPHKEVAATTFNSRRAEAAHVSPQQVAVTAVREGLDNDLRFMAKSIANVCILMNENPLIRYYAPSHHSPLGPLGNPPEQQSVVAQPEGSSRWRSAMATNMRSSSTASENDEHISRRLAQFVQKELDEYRKANHDFPKVIPGETNRQRSVLFITDRSMDPVAPLIHEFTYQAMATDLLPIEGGTRYRYKFENSRGIREEKVATLTETDQVWTSTRHMHLLAANEKLKADFNKFLEDNAVFRGADQSLNGVKDMLAGLPQYQETWEQFSLHLNMAGECNKLFDQNNLSAVADVEQNCATGQTAEGKVPKSVVEDLVLLLENRNLSSTDKARLIALYIMYRDGVSDEDKRRLYQHARLSNMDQDAVNALTYLGARIVRGTADRDIKRKLKQKSATNYEYDQSRYQPVLQTVLEDHFSGKLDQSVFPYVRDAPPPAPPLGTSLGSFRSSPAPTPTAAAPTSLRSQKPSWHKAPPPGGRNNTDALKQRVFVFVAGGMTYSEMRTAYTMSALQNKEVFVGSTHPMNPARFISDLRAISMDGVGSAALPDGLPKPTDRQIPYQEYYDHRYFIKDAPPPPKPQPAPAQMQTHSPAHGHSQLQSARLDPPRGPTHQASSSSLGSGGGGEKLKKDKEKKKRGLFHF